MSVTLHTSHGDMKIEVFCDTVPRLSENFLALAASNYYDGTLFHRNIKGFMVQGGDKTNTGKGRGEQSITGNPLRDEFSPEHRHDKRGVVSMANNGPDSNGAQFFITYSAQPHLNNKYSIIGQVIDGIEVLDSIERVPVEGKKCRPVQEIRLKSVTIHANPLAN